MIKELIKNLKFKTRQSSIINHKSMRGFTLIELLTVIGVMGVVSAMALVLLNPVEQLRKTRDASRKGDLVQVQKALEAYYSDVGSYPTNTVSYTIFDANTGNPVSWGTSWSPYMNILPRDPSTSSRYVYVSSGQSYFLYANLERDSRDPQTCGGNGSPCPNAPVNQCGGGAECNYGVTSPNATP